MEDKPYSVDSSDDINIEEEEEHIEDNPSKYCAFIFECPINVVYFVIRFLSLRILSDVFYKIMHLGLNLPYLIVTYFSNLFRFWLNRNKFIPKKLINNYQKSY